MKPLAFLSFCVVGSMKRTIPFFSGPYRTVALAFVIVRAPPVLPLFTPPTDPASSPELVSTTESISNTGYPPTSKVTVTSFASDSWAMFGYGSGMLPEADGVLQTSGKAKAIPFLGAMGFGHEYFSLR